MREAKSQPATPRVQIFTAGAKWVSMRAADIEHDPQKLVTALERCGADVPHGGFHAAIDVTGLNDPAPGRTAKLHSGEHAEILRKLAGHSAFGPIEMHR